jgi:NB-ARC domain
MTGSIKASQQGLERVDRARHRKGWTKTRTMAWWQDAHTSQATLRRFWRGIAIESGSFAAICHAVGISDWEAIADLDTVDEEVDLPMPAVQPLSAIPDPASPNSNREDWGEAPDIPSFHGRAEELCQLESWMLKDGCKLIVLSGMGGIGKTALAVTLADQIQEQFECLIWRSLKPMPPLENLLYSLLEFCDRDAENISFDSIDRGISKLIECLRQRRCLVILDEVEVIFGCNDRPESSKRDRTFANRRWREGYENYAELLRRVGIERHQSCLLLTSREKPNEIAALEGEKSPVRCWQLRGLREADALALFEDKGFSGAEVGLSNLIKLYGGIPLALKAIATMIQEVFGGNIKEFLSQNTVVLGDRLRTLLREQLSRLSLVEKDVVTWLAIERQPISLARLRTNFLLPPTPSQLMETLVSLERRSLLDKIAEDNCIAFTLQPMVMKYVAEESIEQIIDEIEAVLKHRDLKYFKLLKKYALAKPQSPDSTKNNYDRWMLVRLKDSLLMNFGSEIGLEIREIVPLMRDKVPPLIGYLSRNLLELLKALEIEINAEEWEDISIR